MNHPTISVCVPTYNGEAYLAACLDSVLAQTFGDFELLVVDDVSSDRTIEIAEGYAARDVRVRVVRNPRNLGLVGNWNRCAALARGEWVKFVFQDDLIAPTCLERMLAAGRRGHVLVSCARDFLFDSDTPERDQEYYRGNQAESARVMTADMTVEDYCKLAFDHTDINLVGEPTAVLLHRSVFERFGPFNAHMVQAVDLEYWMRVGTAVGGAHISDHLATFRVHAASTTSNNSTRTSRAARVRLDALVLRHEYAFSPLYEPLRETGRGVRPAHDPEWEFWRAATEALVLDGGAAAIARGDPKSKAEAEEVFAAYPRLRHIPRHYALRFAVSRYLTRSRGAAAAYRATKRLIMRVATRSAAPRAPA